MALVQIVITLDVWDYPHRNPADWDLAGIAENAFGDSVDKVVSVTVEED